MSRPTVQDLVGRIVGSLIHRNERSIARLHPLPEGPVDPAVLPWTARVRAQVGALRDELETIIATTSLPTVAELSGSDQGAIGEWTTFVLFAAGRWIPGNVERAPKLAAALRDVPNLRTAGYTVLGPGAFIPEHRGPTRTLRYQIAMLVPPESGAAVTRVGPVVRVWREDDDLLFDDATPHEARNDGTGPRFLLFVEVGWDLTGRAARFDGAVAWLMNRLADGFARRATDRAGVLRLPPIA